MLSPALAGQFNQRDLTALSQAFLDSSAYWGTSRWLSKNNHYALDSVKKLSEDFNPGGRLKHKHLREYIAASTIVHCLDGWSYLGRAVNAQLSGDNDCARHLGYYSELRAAMSLLASHGIGVFSNEHIAVAHRGRCRRVAYARHTPTRPSGPPTHQFVWQALDTWAESADAKDTIMTVVRSGGQTLAGWTNHYGVTPAITSLLAKDWLRTWGLDISRLAADREARNLSSYRPTRYSSSSPLGAHVVVGFLSRIWNACEPSTDSPFAQLDREIIRATFRQIFKGVEGRTSKQARNRFALRIDGLLGSLAPEPLRGTTWRAFLLDSGPDRSRILTSAAGTALPSDPNHSIQVLARAILLLRIATGSAERLLRSLPAGRRVDLNPLIDIFGRERCLWGLGGMPGSLNDLAKDPADAGVAIEADLPNLTSYSELWRRQSWPAAVFSSFERAGLWGMCG